MTLLDTAFGLTAQGFPVFPCTGKKRPAIAGGDGFHDAVLDPNAVEALFAQAPNAVMVGVPTGEASGFDALDLDPRHGGDVWEADNLHRLPDTRVHSTLSGGRHYLFRHADGVVNTAGKIALGVDTRGEGGYVIMPPSHGYAVINEAEIAPWPGWLLEILLAKPAPPEPGPEGEGQPREIGDKGHRAWLDRTVGRLRDAPDGTKHDTLHGTACALGGRAVEVGIGLGDAIRLLEAALQGRDVKDWKAARKTIEDGFAWGVANPLPLLPDRPGYRTRANGAAKTEAKPNGAHAPDRAGPNGAAEPEPEPGSPEHDAKWAQTPEEEAEERTARHAAIQAAVDAAKEQAKTIEAFPGWTTLLDHTKGRIHRNLGNAMIALANAPPWQGVFGWNEFAERVEVRRQLPTGPRGRVPRELSNFDISNTAAWLQRNRVDVSSAIAHEAIKAVADESRFHPVRDYLAGLTWDGLPRINLWLADHLGAENTELNQAVGSRWLIGLVARVMRPGCQFDNTLIAESRQGRGKSSAFRALADPWFTDQMPDLSHKDALQQVHGVWVVELAELDSLRKVEQSRIKGFLSSRVDRYRVPWERVPVDTPRQNGFCGTVNPSDANGYLRDETGARRFWCVECAIGWEVGQEIDIPALASVRDQLWAEAVVRFEKGDPWHLERPELQQAQAEAAEERRESDAREPRIADFLATKLITNMDEILGDCLHIPPERWDRPLQTQIGVVVSNMKWKRRRKTYKGKFQWCYIPPGSY